MTVLYLRNTHTNRRYRIVHLDRENNKIVLRGDHAEFEEDYDKQRFKALGYVLEQGDADAEQPGL